MTNFLNIFKKYFKTTISEAASCCRGRDDRLFQKCPILSLHQSENQTDHKINCRAHSKLNGLGVNSCLALRKPLISEAVWQGKTFTLLGTGLWSNRKVKRSDDSTFILFQCDWPIRIRTKLNEVFPLMNSICCTSLWGQYYDVFTSVSQVFNIKSTLPEYSVFGTCWRRL